MSIETPLDSAITRDFLTLPTQKIQAEYVWLGGLDEVDVRSKTRTLEKAITSLEDLPSWNYDGSSTGQAPGEDSEVIIKPVRIYKDPFRRAHHILVLCETYLPDGSPHPSNTRVKCNEWCEKIKADKPWFGIEQEYTLFTADTKWPLGWPKNGYPGEQGPYYCGAGADKAFGRDIVESHYRACLYAGVKISGVNAEVMPGQWEYQVGAVEGIQAGDDMWMSRYLMFRVCEMFNVNCSFDPKPIAGDWNGAGCHTNYSTEAMRNEGGYAVIIDAIKELEKKHQLHIEAYGSGNERRLTGLHETASITKFSYGVANRGASVRIPRQTHTEQMGYLEDRRPSSNMDPYVVCGLIVATTNKFN